MPEPEEAVQIFYESRVRKGSNSGAFDVAEWKLMFSQSAMCEIAKALVDRGEVDEAMVLEMRPVKKFKKYRGEG